MTDPKAKLRELIKDIRIGMLTTVDQDGSLRSRPMAVQQVDGDESLWFFTRADSPKVDEVQQEDEHVNASFAEPKKNDYVSVSGTATLVHDKAKVKELWSEHLKTWFPKGVDDPQIALLKVKPDKAEYWDAPSSTVVYLYGYAKAKLTGKSPKPGEHEKVKL